MYNFQVGDIVARKSYGNDIHFIITNIFDRENNNPLYILRGLLYRIEADSEGSDLVKQNPMAARLYTKNHIAGIRRKVYVRNSSRGVYKFDKRWEKPGKVLHIDSSREFLEVCTKHYRQAKIDCTGYLANEDEQPSVIKGLLARNKPDILVITGHDGIKKNNTKPESIDNYRNSKYFVQSVKEARKYEPDFDKLCIFAGACQSYYEAIMAAGSNFASSPGRILINAIDPAIVSEKIALTDTKTSVTPKEISEITISGAKGIGGINTKGHLIRK